MAAGQAVDQYQDAYRSLFYSVPRERHGTCSQQWSVRRCVVFLVEQSWATKVEVQPAFAIHAYYRFQYDIWILAGHRSLARRFINRFRDLASRVFESELVECSANFVDMIGVITTVEGNRIHTEPRQNYNGTPLSQQSAHPLKVHLRWPAVYMRAEVDLCLTDQRREHVQSEFCQKIFNKAMFQKQCWIH